MTRHCERQSNSTPPNSSKVQQPGPSEVPHQQTPPLPSKDEKSVQLRALDKDEKVGDDVSVIVLIGPTGTGKSNFIETLGSITTNGPKVKDLAKARLDSGTQEVNGYRMEHRHLNIYTIKPIILVDTPGLSDRRKSEMQVLSQIKKWMKKSGVKSVDRLLYMDRISDNRMPRSKTKSLEIFKALCGTDAANRTVVVTTMWDLMWNKRLKDHAAHRFKLLKEKHWNDFLDQGSKIETFDNTFDSALKNLRALGQPSQITGPAFAFEKDVGMKETEMGRRAFQVLTERYENLDVSLQVVEQDIKHSAGMQNAELDALLLKQKTEITHDLKEVTAELEAYSPEYKPFRDQVHKELDRAGSPDSTTTTNTTNSTQKPSGFKAKLEGWLTKWKEFASGGKEKTASTSTSIPTSQSKPTVYNPPVNLPSIHEFIETGKVTGGESSSGTHT